MLKVPQHPLALAQFGLKSLQSGKQIAARFRTRGAKGLWAGLVAHSMIPLGALTPSAIAFVLTLPVHRNRRPIPKGRSQSIADAIEAYFRSLRAHHTPHETVDLEKDMEGEGEVRAWNTR